MFSWPPNYDSCYTLSSVITKEGVGLHSGEKTRIKISPFEKEGYYVSFADKPDDIFKLNQDLIGSTMLCTAVKLAGRNLYTIEHLLASLAGCGLSYIHIKLTVRKSHCSMDQQFNGLRHLKRLVLKEFLSQKTFLERLINQ